MPDPGRTDRAMVEARILFRPVLDGRPSDDPGLNALVLFWYDPTDPLSVHIDVPDGSRVWQREIARDVLDSGRRTPGGAGMGDLRVRAGEFEFEEGVRRYVLLDFFCDDGWRTFGVSPRALASFLRGTYAVVPAGQESKFLDVEQALRLLGATA